MLSKLPSAPFPLKQFLLITCTLTIAYFWLVATDAHLVHLKQPSSFTTMAFLLLLSKRPSVPFPLKQLLFKSHALLRLPMIFLFCCNQCSSHPPKTTFLSHSLLLPFCCCSLNFHGHPFNWSKATVITCTLTIAYFWLSCNWCSSRLPYTTFTLS